MTTDTQLARAAELLRSADALLFCAGAGMGVDSGLPDFRGDQGFWRAYPPYARLGLSFEEVADPAHFSDDPELAWGFYGHRLEMYRRTEPHTGFAILHRWASQTPGGARIFTSNVDGQFQRAGFVDDRVAECHGSIHHLQCALGCSWRIWPADEVAVDVDEDTMRARRPLPSCPGCGTLARPNILMFGDPDWIPDRSQETLDEVNSWRRDLRRRDMRLVVVELGAGSAIPTVRRYAELAGASSGSLIRINPRESEVRHDHGVALPMGALDALNALDELVTSEDRG